MPVINARGIVPIQRVVEAHATQALTGLITIMSRISKPTGGFSLISRAKAGEEKKVKIAITAKSENSALEFMSCPSSNANQNTRFRNNLGLAYGEKGQYDLALAEFKLASNEAEAHHHMAEIYFKKGPNG